MVKNTIMNTLPILYQSKYLMLRTESPSGICKKLRTVAASNNRVHPTRSLLLLLIRATYISYCSSRTFRSWWTAHSAIHQPRGCNTNKGCFFAKISFTQNENVSGSAFFKVCWSQHLNGYSWNFEIFMALFRWKWIKKCPAILPNFLMILILYACHFSAKLSLLSSFPIVSFISSLLTPPPTHRHAFPPLFWCRCCCFVYLCCLMLLRCVLLL